MTKINRIGLIRLTPSKTIMHRAYEDRTMWVKSDVPVSLTLHGDQVIPVAIFPNKTKRVCVRSGVVVRLTSEHFGNVRIVIEEE